MPILPWITLTLRRAAWAPLLVLGLHLFAALALGLYRIWPPTDIPMHFLGGIAIAFFFAHAYRAAEELDLLGRPAAVLGEVTVFALVGSATVFWEFAEFLFDRYVGTHLQDGVDDTLGDMLMGLLGGLAFLAGRRFFAARRRAR
jgi:hypothetical protein